MMPHRIGPQGIQLYIHGRVLRGVCPNGMEVFIQNHPTLTDLEQVHLNVVIGIEQEMLRTIKFLMERKPANVS